MPALARRVATTDDVGALGTLAGPDYAAAWEVPVTDGDERGAEDWARATFEGAPPALRAFIVAGWTTVLGLRLGPRPSPDHVLGWPIVDAAPARLVLETGFRFGTAQNVLRLDGGRVLLATLVRYEKRGGRTAWSSAAPLHHRIVPYLLGRAASDRPSP